MKKHWLGLIIMAIVFLLGMQSTEAQAAPYIEVAIIDSVNNIITFVQSDTGGASFSGAVGDWNIELAIGKTYPFDGSTQSSPFITLYLDATTSASAGGDLIVFTDSIGYTGPISGGMTGPFIFEGLGTVANGTTGTLDLFALYNSHNGLFETDHVFYSVKGTLGTYNTGAFNETRNISAFLGTTSPYALGIQAQIHHSGQGYTVFNSSFGVSVVPEPTTMLLMGLGLIGLAGVKRKM